MTAARGREAAKVLESCDGGMYLKELTSKRFDCGIRESSGISKAK